MVESIELDVSLAEKPFRNPDWRPAARRNRTARQILMDEAKARADKPLDPNLPTYQSIEAPPSLQPARKYCDVTGLESKYTDPKSGLRYYNTEVYAAIRGMSHGADQEYLRLRGAAVALR